MRKILLLTVPFVLVMLLSSSADAQRTNASIRGTISDASGAVMPGASVTVSDEETGLTRTTVTNSDGIYAVGQLPVAGTKSMSR